jgi:NADH-quinone oxidoreductase subunit J
VLYLIVSLAAQAVIYIQLNALFVGALLIIVYAGAILVLFLFGIMLLNLRGERFDAETNKLGKGTKYTLAVIFFAELVILIRQVTVPRDGSSIVSRAVEGFGDVKPVAELLYTKYLFQFELTSILLLVAVVGAVVMAITDRGDRMKEGGQ